MHPDRGGEGIKLDRWQHAETILDSDESRGRGSEGFHGYHNEILLLFLASANGVKSSVFTGNAKIFF
jgi:hypothetical protein